jgi:hypothetical protein
MPDILTNPGTTTAAFIFAVLFTLVVVIVWIRKGKEKGSENICPKCGAEKHTTLRRTTHGLSRKEWVANDIYVTECGTPDCSEPPKSTIITRAATKEEIDAIVAR